MKTLAYTFCAAALLLMSALRGFAAEQVAAGMHRDVEFANVGDVTLKLDAFVPEGQGPFPTCILVHGGGFINGTKQSYITPIFEPLSKAGFVWFTIDYRLAPGHRWPACENDVVAAVRWVKAHAGKYKVDPGRIALVGESAGGHLVSYVGTQDQAEKLGLAAIVPFYAPHDLVLQTKGRGMLGPSMKALLGLTELSDEAWQTLQETSATAHLHAKMPPYLLIHGTNDKQVPYEQSTKFQEQMRALGNSCDLITIEGGGHGMGGWDKLASDYRQQMIDWLQKTMK